MYLNVLYENAGASHNVGVTCDLISTESEEEDRPHCVYPHPERHLLLRGLTRRVPGGPQEGANGERLRRIPESSQDPPRSAQVGRQKSHRAHPGQRGFGFLQAQPQTAQGSQKESREGAEEEQEEEEEGKGEEEKGPRGKGQEDSLQEKAQEGHPREKKVDHKEEKSPEKEDAEKNQEGPT